MVDYRNLICPICSRMLDICTSRKDETYFQGLCRTCLCYWDIKRIDCSDADIQELAQE